MNTPVEAQPIRSELVGIGALISKYIMEVPDYQRPFSWEQEHARRMFEDFKHHLSKKDQDDYFLGTVVLTRRSDGTYYIVDGQQRILTTTILFSALRNHFYYKSGEDSGNSERASIISKKYLSEQDFETLDHKCRITVAPEDRDVFLKLVIEQSNNLNLEMGSLTETQKRMNSVANEAKSFVEKLAFENIDPTAALNNLRVFIEKNAKVVCLDVSSDTNAYVIFEVLNDRGLDLSITDLLKNHVFSLCNETQLSQSQTFWSKMRNSIMAEYAENEIKDFIRQAWIVDNGLIRHRSLYNEIKKSLKRGSDSIKYTKNLSVRAEIFSSFKNADSGLWVKYSEEVRKSLRFFVLSGVTQIRPLLLSIFEKFSVKEVNKSIPMIACWVVRHLIVGAVGSSQLENNYAASAALVSSENITTADQLFREFKGHYSDEEFRDAFSKANVAKGSLARWYLKELEIEKHTNQEKIVNIDTLKVNLEHIMPKTKGDGWDVELSDDDYRNLTRRLGNQVLMDSKENSRLGNGNWDDKKVKLSESSIELTREVAACSQWTQKEIGERQVQLAKLAVLRWPNKYK